MSKYICPKNLTEKKPWCLKHPCYYMAKGTCKGAIIAKAGQYSYEKCPDHPNAGGIARCGEHLECKYCKDLLK